MKHIVLDRHEFTSLKLNDPAMGCDPYFIDEALKPMETHKQWPGQNVKQGFDDVKNLLLLPYIICCNFLLQISGT